MLIEKVKTEPSPGLLLTVISSFIAFRISLAMERPSPVPAVPYLALSPLKNLSKTIFTFSGSMPVPVSLTDI